MTGLLDEVPETSMLVAGTAKRRCTPDRDADRDEGAEIGQGVRVNRYNSPY